MRGFSFFILILLFLQATDFYKVLLFPIGLSTSVFSTFTLIMGIMFIFFKKKVFLKLMKKPLFKLWIRLIWFFPLIFIVLHFFLGNLQSSQFVYYLSFISFFGVLFSITVLFSFDEFDNHRLKRMILWASVIGTLGIVISYVNYPLIIKIISTSEQGAGRFDPNSGAFDRAPGFYGQSNNLARALVTLFIGLAPFYFVYKNRGRSAILLILIFLTAIYLTGSRTSLLIFFFIVTCCFPLFFSDRPLPLRLFQLMSYLFFGVFLFILLLNFSTMLTSLGVPDLSQRLNFDQNNLEGDVSVNHRLETADRYMEHISRNFLVGKGPAYRNEMIEQGVFRVGSQNEYLETALAFGIFAAIVYFFSLLYTFFKVNSKSLIGMAIRVLCLALILYGFSMNYLFVSRITIVVFGVLLGIYLRERDLLNKSEN